MNTLEILKAKINLKTTIIKFKASLDELVEKHESRTDLITSMKESLECKANLRNQIIIAEHKHEIDKLKEIINDNKLEL